MFTLVARLVLANDNFLVRVFWSLMIIASNLVV